MKFCYIFSREKMAAPIPHSTSALKPTVDAKSNLPNFESVTYNFPLSSDDVPQILFSDIYFHLVSRKTLKMYQSIM